MTVVADPLLRKRKTRQPIGYEVVRYLCLDCAPESVVESTLPLVEGDDAGIPYECVKCGKPLVQAGLSK